MLAVVSCSSSDDVTSPDGSTDAATPAVWGDETQIHQIAMNLITNASHAMEAGGTVELGLAPFHVTPEFAAMHLGLSPGPHARLTVSDGGSGISPEALEHVLEPFYTTKPPGQGTGLGLSVVHGIVQSLGGAILITSTMGAGTRVEILLPAAQSGAQAAPARASAAASAPSDTWPHVLVVEDDRDLASMLGRQLEAFEYRATVHQSGADALADFRSRPNAFDVLMTDHHMSGMTGIALARQVLLIRHDLPVILVSGVPPAGEWRELEATGITLVLKKPHTGSELDEALRAALKRG